MSALKYRKKLIWVWSESCSIRLNAKRSDTDTRASDKLTQFEHYSFVSGPYIIMVVCHSWDLPKVTRYRTPDKEHIFIFMMPRSSPNTMFDHLLESSHWDDSTKWSNIVFGEEIMQAVLIEVNSMLLIWSSNTAIMLQHCLSQPTVVTGRQACGG